MEKQIKGIYFGSKAENSERSREEFLAPSPAERFEQFLKSFDTDLFKKYVNPEEMSEN